MQDVAVDSVCSKSCHCFHLRLCLSLHLIIDNIVVIMIVFVMQLIVDIIVIIVVLSSLSLRHSRPCTRGLCFAVCGVVFDVIIANMAS